MVVFEQKTREQTECFKNHLTTKEVIELLPEVRTLVQILITFYLCRGVFINSCFNF